MAWEFVPVSPSPDNRMALTLHVNEKKISAILRFRYNVIGEYWFMDIINAKTDTPLISGVPLVTGDFPAADLLEQFGYKGLGKAIIAAKTDNPPTQAPDMKNLGIEFALAWGDDSALGS